MLVSIRLQNFRSYGDESFEFEPGVNIVVGPNASGKTNMLEAVMVASTGFSYRASSADLVKNDCDWSRIDGYFEHGLRTVKIKHLENSAEHWQKIYEIDDRVYKRLPLDKTIPLVFFEPNQLQLMIKGPETRREFLDDLLERTVPEFKQTAARYKRALSQRNSLLKMPPRQIKSQLFAWNIKLSELAEKVVIERVALIDKINQAHSYREQKDGNKEEELIHIQADIFREIQETSFHSSRLLC